MGQDRAKNTKKDVCIDDGHGPRRNDVRVEGSDEFGSNGVRTQCGASTPSLASCSLRQGFCVDADPQRNVGDGTTSGAYGSRLRDRAAGACDIWAAPRHVGD